MAKITRLGPFGYGVRRRKPTAIVTGRLKVWTASAWTQKPAKVWSGSAWVAKPVKYWDGTKWVGEQSAVGGTVIASVQGGSTNTASTVTTLSLAFSTTVGVGNTIIVYYGVNGTTGTISDDKANTYTAMPTNMIGGYRTGIVHAVGVTNGPKTITLTTPVAASYPFIIIEEFSGVLAYETTSGNVYATDTTPLVSGNVTPTQNGSLLFTSGWGGNGGPITVASPFSFIRDGGAGFNNVSTGFYVQPTAAAIGATWTPPAAMTGASRILSFKPKP